MTREVQPSRVILTLSEVKGKDPVCVGTTAKS